MINHATIEARIPKHCLRPEANVYKCSGDLRKIYWKTFQAFSMFI